MKNDGLNSVLYERIGLQREKLYTRINVQINQALYVSIVKHIIYVHVVLFPSWSPTSTREPVRVLRIQVY